MAHLPDAWKKTPSLTAIALALIVCVAGSWFVAAHYGGGSLWPGLISNFAASLVAFMLALAWERDRERRQLLTNAAEVERRQRTEIQRRLAPVQVELEKDAVSLKELAERLQSDPHELKGFTLLHPQLLEGAWNANAPQLFELVADYELISDLATTYGRLEELRWRLRFRSEKWSAEIDPMTIPLVEELRQEVSRLLRRISGQIAQPTVQARGLRELYWHDVEALLEAGGFGLVRQGGHPSFARSTTKLTGSTGDLELAEDDDQVGGQGAND